MCGKISNGHPNTALWERQTHLNEMRACARVIMGSYCETGKVMSACDQTSPSRRKGRSRLAWVEFAMKSPGQRGPGLSQCVRVYSGRMLSGSQQKGRPQAP